MVGRAGRHPQTFVQMYNNLFGAFQFFFVSLFFVSSSMEPMDGRNGRRKCRIVAISRPEASTLIHIILNVRFVLDVLYRAMNILGVLKRLL